MKLQFSIWISGIFAYASSTRLTVMKLFDRPYSTCMVCARCMQGTLILVVHTDQMCILDYSLHIQVSWDDYQYEQKLYS